MSFENDYVWLLKTLASNSTSINQLYNLKVKVPEMILLQGGDPKLWFYQDKDDIKLRNENYLKMKLVKEYFVDPKSVSDPQVFDFDYQMYAMNKDPSSYNPDKVLFNVYIEQASKQVKVVKKITKRVADDLFNLLQESSEYCKQWSKIFSYIPTKNAGLYEVTYTKSLKEDIPPKLKITKKDYSLRNIEVSDYRKNDSPVRERMFPKDDRMITENNFSSIASSINTALDKTVKAIVRFLEGKTKMSLGEMHLEFVVDSGFTTWLIGSTGIHFYGQDGTIEKDVDKESIIFPKAPLKQFFTCPGSYCKFYGETNFYQEGDEAINLYNKKTPKKEIFEISFKSLILDVIERCKHIHRMQENLPEYDLKQIVHFAETHPFDFRKYYSIGEILESYLFKAYKVSNLYKTVRVCRNCHFIYEKIDGYRVQKILKADNRKFNKDEAKLTIEKFYERHAVPTNATDDKKAVFSKMFYRKLDVFDKDILEILGLEREVETFEDFFELTSEKMRMMSPVTPRDHVSISKYGMKSENSVKFPKIHKETIKDPNNFFKHERLKMHDKAKAEVVGYKHYLGHAKNLTNSGAGHIVSKSSIQLNKLQDKINRFNLMIGGSSMEKSIVKEGQSTQRSSEYETFKVKIEAIKDTSHSTAVKDRLDELEQLKLSIDKSRISPLKVVGDKFNFISEQERTELFEKENRKKEKETQQKDFLATNNLLAQSIANKRNSVQSVDKKDRHAVFKFDEFLTVN